MGRNLRPARELEARGQVAVSSIPAPEIRPFAGPADYARMADVYAACVPVDGLDEVMTIEDFAHFVENPVGFDPAHDLLLAQLEGGVVGYGWASHRVEAAGDRAERPVGDRAERPVGDEIHMLRVYIHPARRRQGLGSALLDRIQARSRQWDSRPPGERAAYLQTFVSDTEADGLAFFPSRGFVPVRYAFKMERDLRTPVPSLPLPPGLELRPAAESHDRAIWEAQREAFQDHWGYTPWTEEHFQRFTSYPHYDRSLWRVAWEGDQVAGMVLSYINPEENRQYRRLRGYTEDIAVRRPWRRRGLASALIARSLTALQERGMAEAALSVDAENPTGALRVYERLGYHPVKQWTVFRRPLDPASIAAGR